MKQLNLAEAGLQPIAGPSPKKKTRKDAFLTEMATVVLWFALRCLLILVS